MFSHLQSGRAKVVDVKSDAKDLICIGVDHTQLCPGLPRTLPAEYFFSGDGVCKGCHFVKRAGLPAQQVGHAHTQHEDVLLVPSSLAPRSHPLIASKKKKAKHQSVSGDMLSDCVFNGPHVIEEERVDPSDAFEYLSRTGRYDSSSSSAPAKEDRVNISKYTIPLVEALIAEPYAAGVSLEKLLRNALDQKYESFEEFRGSVLKTLKRAAKKQPKDSEEWEKIKALSNYFEAIYDEAQVPYLRGEDCYSPDCAACGVGGDLLVMCDGDCMRSFHFKCVGVGAEDEPDDDEKWLCPACADGVPVLKWDKEAKDYYKFCQAVEPIVYDNEANTYWDPYTCSLRKVDPTQVSNTVAKRKLGETLAQAKIWNFCRNKTALPRAEGE